MQGHRLRLAPRVALALLTLSPILLAAGPAAADGDTPAGRPSMAGLPGVGIRVEAFRENQRRAGFEEATFRTDVETKLRAAGIRILSEREQRETPGEPYLYVNANPVVATPGPRDIYSIALELKQDAFLARNPDVLLPGVTTWVKGGVGSGTLAEIREHLGYNLDLFVAAWRRANPQPSADAGGPATVRR